MRAVKEKVGDLIDMLDRESKESGSLVNTMHRLQSYLDEEPKSIIQESLDRLLNRIRAEAAKITRRSIVVLISPEGRVTIEETYDENSDFWLRKLKSRGFRVTRLDGFSSLIQSLKSEVAEGNLIPVIEFLRANTMPPAYSPAPALTESEHSKPSAPSRWKLSDFLPALPPHLPLPRGLFKD